jgi:hypothetical protein
MDCHWLDFKNRASLGEICFSSDSQVKEIDRFQGWQSLSGLEIPSSVEIIRKNGFKGCISLNGILFSSGSHRQQLFGFQESISLCGIEIPSSVQQIG